MNFIVLGTDTGIGKTLVSTLLCIKYPYHRYWKPIQCGTADGTDTEWVADHIGFERVLSEVYRFPDALSPHASAKLAGVTIESCKIQRAYAELSNTIVEGAGGLLVPLNDESLLIDLVARLHKESQQRSTHASSQIILVARSVIGTINHTLLSLEALRQRGIEPLGVVMVGELNPSNRMAIESYGKTNVVGQIPWLNSFERKNLEQAAARID